MSLVSCLLAMSMHPSFQVQLSFRGSEGDYQVLVSVHSLVLLESRCAECYGKAGESIQRDSCCDGINRTAGPCPATCDVLLRFCQLGDLLQLNLINRTLVQGTRCVHTPLSSYFDDWIGNDLKAGESYPEYDEGGSIRETIFETPVTYQTEQWVSLQ